MHLGQTIVLRGGRKTWPTENGQLQYESSTPYVTHIMLTQITFRLGFSKVACMTHLSVFHIEFFFHKGRVASSRYGRLGVILIV
jgi:hypothetical protein